MARRLFNGRQFSEDGWPYVDEGSCTWATPPGTAVHIQIQNGQPFSILRAWEADWNANIEPLRDGDTACFTQGNSVSTSNHPSGTAVDSDWENHPMGPQAPMDPRAGFSAAQVAELRRMIAFYTYKGVQMVWWANDWNSPHDSMHSQMGYGTYDSKNDRVNPVVDEFIARFIRADGYSTYKRDNVIVPPTSGDAVDVLMRATGITHDKAVAIMPTVIQGLRLSQCTTALRVAMWLAQWGEESGSFVYTEEIAKNGRYAPYIGRTWGQITWDYNYRAFSQWCFDQGLVPTADYFVVNYQALADQQWAGIGPAWYWTVARPQINSLCDAGDLVAVTQAINGGQNGAADRKARYDRALALGDELLALTATSGDEMSAQTERMIAEIHDELFKKFPSRSDLRENDEPLDTITGFGLWTNGSVDFLALLEAAKLRHPPSLARLRAIAASTDPDQQDRAQLAQAILAEASKPVVTVDNTNAVQSAPPQVVYVDRPTPAAAAPVQAVGDTADHIAATYRANSALLASDIDKPAADQLVNIIKTKTEGAQS